MPTIESLKAFLVDQYNGGFLPSDPSFLFSAEFLRHLSDFIEGHGHPPQDLAQGQTCPRCDEMADGLQRQIDQLQVWARCLKGGARHAHE
jgi:hypothetical protein